MKETKTIGQQADKLAKEYFETYKYFKNDKDKKLSNMAENLATHDILVKKLISEFALEQLKEMIEEYKKEVKK